MPQPSIIDERLAEIDRRLRTIQTGLVPSESSAPPSDETDGDLGEIAAVAQALEEPPLRLDDSPPRSPVRLRAAPESGDRVETGRSGGAVADDDPAVLLAQLRELSAAHERLLELHRELLSQYAELLEHRAAETHTVPVTAGPFADGTAVRAFEHAMAQLPQVTGVAVREYLGGDRVVLDVRLA